MNCIIVDDDEMSRVAIKYLVEKTNCLKLIAVCKDAIEASNIVRNETVDIIFLDIELPEMSGMEFINSVGNNYHFILVSAKKGYALDAFAHSVVDYLLKPIAYPRFLQAVEKVQKLYAEQGNRPIKQIFLKSDGRLLKINAEDILWVEALADYVTIHTVAAHHTIHSTMKAIESNLPAHEFVRVHRSFIVRLDKIATIEDDNLFINKQLIPIGRSYRDELMKRLNLL